MTEVEIITIGDELLIGQVVDTNSAFMAEKLNQAGFDIRWKTTVGDIKKDITDALKLAFSRASIILVTGGLGPTNDDITKHTLCDFFNTKLVFDAETLKTVEEVVGQSGRQLNELTRSQAFVPQNCTVIQNRVGTAPVTWFEHDGKILVSMPGVPYEMKWAMENEIIPRLKERFSDTGAILHRSFWVKNYSESMLAQKLTQFEESLSDFVKLAYLPTSGVIRLRLTGKHSDALFIQSVINAESEKLKSILGEDIFSDTDDSLEVSLHKTLISKRLTLSVAESCTGGKLASLFTAQAGSSQYFQGGVVSYSNEAKINMLGVKSETLENYGAVSQEVVEQMAAGVCEKFQTDCAIAVSGVAGPSGGTPEKPVGTVWIAISFNKKIVSQQFLFTKNRETNILRSCNNGIRMLMEAIGK